MAIVVFDPAAFKLAYPEFATVTDPRLLALFDIAQSVLLDNTDGSPVMDLPFRTRLFDLAVAHMLLLFGAAPTLGADGTFNNAPPGRISSATEGTVSVASELDIGGASASSGWWTQTQYGLMYWMATSRFRSFKYFPNGGSGIGVAKAYGVPPIYRPGGL